MLESYVPPHFWCEALSTAIHLINWLPSPILQNVSPFFKLFRHSPSYFDLHTFSCVHFVHLPAYEHNKFTTRSVKCVFLGYVITQKRYACYDPQSRRIRISRNVVFFENQYFFPSFIDPPSSSLSPMPHFSDSSTIVEQFKPCFVYERHRSADPSSLHDSCS